MRHLCQPGCVRRWQQPANWCPVSLSHTYLELILLKKSARHPQSQMKGLHRHTFYSQLENCSDIQREPRGGTHPRLCVENLTSCTQTQYQWNDNEARAHCTQTGNVLFECILNNFTISRITEHDTESCTYVHTYIVLLWRKRPTFTC